MMKQKLFVLALCAGLPGLLFAKSKNQPDDLVVPADTSAIEQRVDELGQTVATLQNQIAEMVAQFQTMNGEIGRAYKKNTEQDTVIRDSSSRLQLLEDKMVMLTTQLQELKTEGLLKPKTAVLQSEYQKFSKGVEAINSQQYDVAIKELQKFMLDFKKSTYYPYAQFWVAEANYMKGDFALAIKEYQKVVSGSPKSSKVPPAMYRQGMSLFQMQRYDDAVVFFGELIKRHPQTLEATQARTQIARIDRIKELQRQQQLEAQTVN